jgi:hypothetical protein
MMLGTVNTCFAPPFFRAQPAATGRNFTAPSLLPAYRACRGGGVSRSAEIRKTLWVAAAKQVSTGPGLIPAQADDKGKTYLPLTNSTAVPGFPLLFLKTSKARA